VITASTTRRGEAARAVCGNAQALLEAHQARITNLHIKDRKRNQGDNVAWGQGDTPIQETLTWLQRRKSSIRAYVEYEYAGSRDVVAEVSAWADFARKVRTG
jgi:hypothetical protein